MDGSHPFVISCVQSMALLFCSASTLCDPNGFSTTASWMMFCSIYHITLIKQLTLTVQQLYLHITMLSEIMESNGAHIVDHLLDNMAKPLPSTLQWPHQECPLNATWCTWHNTIQTMYTGAHNTHLQQPLGKWLFDTTHQGFSWEWVVCPTSMNLYHHCNNHWACYSPIAHCQTYNIYDTTCLPGLVIAHPLRLHRPHRISSKTM